MTLRAKHQVTSASLLRLIQDNFCPGLPLCTSVCGFGFFPPVPLFSKYKTELQGHLPALI